MRILVTGGAGYIGSHTCVELLNAGYELVVVDNLSNSKIEALRRVEEIAGKTVDFHQVDLLDQTALTKVFNSASVEAVIHFAGFKAVGESVEKPLWYYHNNVTGTLVLLEVMRKFGVKASDRGLPPFGRQPIRAHKADYRRHVARFVRFGSGVEYRVVALLQPGGSPP